MRFLTLPIDYSQPVFRPPSEADSVILQVTLGCSWNQCGFCEMYTMKKYRPRPIEELRHDIRRLSDFVPNIRKVFLADGNALSTSTQRLAQVLESLREAFPELSRVSAYASPNDVLRKSESDLERLRKAGLTRLYIGVESGDDETLGRVNKGETHQSSIDGLRKAGEAGFCRSVMILNGLGGRLLSRAHAENSARVINATQPEYLATLVVSFPLGEERFRRVFGEGYEPMTQRELFEELHYLIQCLELKETEYRSNHASNYLALKGRLNHDKEAILGLLDLAIHDPSRLPLRPESERGL